MKLLLFLALPLLSFGATVSNLKSVASDPLVNSVCSDSQILYVNSATGLMTHCESGTYQVITFDQAFTIVPPVVVVPPPPPPLPVVVVAGVTPNLVTSKPDGFKDAKVDCGLAGNGTTDDTAKLQACVTSNLKVWFPNSQYYVKGVSYLLNNIELVGQSLATQFISTPGTNHVFWLPKTGTVTNVSIHGFTFDGAGIGGDTIPQTGIKINENRFQNFTAANASWVPNNHGIYIDAMVHNSDFSHNDFVNMQPSTLTAANPDGDGDYPRSGIWLFGFDGVTTSWNHFTNVYEGIKLCQAVPNQTAPVGQNIDVSHNVFDLIHRMPIEIQSNDGCGRGKWTGWVNTKNVTVNYNSINSTYLQYWGSFGISFANPPVQNVEIAHNLINFSAYPYANRGLGIEVGGQPFNVHDNVMAGPWGLGIAYFSGSTTSSSTVNNWACNRNSQVGNMSFGPENNPNVNLKITESGNTILQACPVTLPVVK